MSARKVATAIGYTVGTLYLVFENIDDLILNVNARTLDRLHSRMSAVRANALDPGDYVVKAHYYGSDALRKTLRSRVFVTVTRDFGRPGEERVRHAFVLEKQGELEDVLSMRWP